MLRITGVQPVWFCGSSSGQASVDLQGAEAIKSVVPTTLGSFSGNISKP